MKLNLKSKIIISLAVLTSILTCAVLMKGRKIIKQITPKVSSEKLTMFGLKLGDKVPSSAECEDKYQSKCSRIAESSNDFTACHINTPNDDGIEKDITVCISESSRRIGYIKIYFPPKTNNQLAENERLKSIFEKLEKKLDGKAEAEYGEVQNGAFRGHLKYSDFLSGEKVEAFSLFSNTVDVDIFSDSSIEMLIEEKSHMDSEKSSLIRDDLIEKTKSFNF